MPRRKRGKARSGSRRGTAPATHTVRACRAGTEQASFKTGEQGQSAVQVIDNPGNELLVLKEAK